MTSPLNKISFEQQKQTIIRSITSIRQTMLDRIDGLSQGILGRAKSIVRQAVSAGQAFKQSIAGLVSRPRDILDPNQADLLQQVERFIDTAPPNLNFDDIPVDTALSAASNTLSQLTSRQLEEIDRIVQAVSQAYSQLFFDSDSGGQTPIDNTSQIASGMPDTNEGIPSEGSPEVLGILRNIQTTKQGNQTFKFEDHIQKLNELRGNTVGEDLSIYETMRGLMQSSDVYLESLDNSYTDPYSDLVGLLTIGHTIDTPALDPEDWFIYPNNENVLTYQGITDRVMMGPASIVPVTSKHNVKLEIQNEIQTAYNDLNRLMYYCLYRERYINKFPSGMADYPVPRTTSQANSLFGFKLPVDSVSFVNMGDYASLSFAKINSRPEQELLNLEVNEKLVPLIGYLNNLKSLNSIYEKPIYTVSIQGESILVDSRGNRFLLPASSADTTSMVS
jgi:hypothetical protein